MSMRYVFFGTPRMARLVLESLLAAGLMPAAVVANPDRPAGRKRILTPPPVKELLRERDLLGKVKLFQPERVSEIRDELAALDPDLFAVCAYAQIIPGKVLAIPARGAVGIHPSLLPKYRGPSPMPSAILAGEAETGVTLYLMDKEVDHGPTLAAAKLAVGSMDYLELEASLAALGAELFAEAIPRYLGGSLEPRPQDHGQATFTSKFSTDDGFVPWAALEAAVGGDAEAAKVISRKIRALNPEPGAWTLKGDLRIKLLRAELHDGVLVLKEIQRAGKTPEPVRARLP